MSRVHVCLILSLLSGMARAVDVPVNVQRASLGFSYETLALPADENLGLIGLHYHRQTGRMYGGLAAFGAVNGQRGGFFTGGFEGGWRQALSGPWRLDVGMFAGGGGGDSAPQGGGLMLKPYAGLMYDYKDWQFGVQLARVRFPNGDIDSSHLSFLLVHSFDSFGVPGWVSPAQRWYGHSLAGRAIARRDYLFGARFWTYAPLSGTRDTSGARAEAGLNVIGFDLDTFMTEHVFTGLQAGGAVAGDADGYAEVLWSLGWQLQRSSGWAWRNTLAAGSAGGGRVDTDNGLIVRLTTGLRYRFGNAWQLSLDAGYLAAPSGAFKANVIGVQLGRFGLVPVPVERDTAAAMTVTDHSAWRPRWWRLRGGVLSYRSPENNWRKSGVTAAANKIDLIASTVDVMPSGRHVYMTATAAAAGDGGAGGYAVGLLGAGWRQALAVKRLEFNAELSAGAAGGGGIDVGGGLVMQLLTALEYRITDYYSLMLTAGRVAAADGNLRADVIGVSVSYRQSSLVPAD